MSQFVSKNWVLFAESPTSLLKREFIKQAYFYVDSISKLKVSKILVIGKEDRILIYINANEDRKNYFQAKRDYQTKRVEKYFIKFREIIKKSRIVDSAAIDRLLNPWQRLGPIILYSWFIERILTEKYKKVGTLKKTEKIRLQ